MKGFVAGNNLACCRRPPVRSWFFLEWYHRVRGQKERPKGEYWGEGNGLKMWHVVEEHHIWWGKVTRSLLGKRPWRFFSAVSWDRGNEVFTECWRDSTREARENTMAVNTTDYLKHCKKKALQRNKRNNKVSCQHLEEEEMDSEIVETGKAEITVVPLMLVSLTPSFPRTNHAGLFALRRFIHLQLTFTAK